MSKNIVKTKIKENIKNIKLDDNTIVILKGIPLSAVGINESIDLAKVIENKFLYFGSIFGKRQFVSYEEFLLLYDFILSQYKKIYIFVSQFLCLWQQCRHYSCKFRKKTQNFNINYGKRGNNTGRKLFSVV